MAKRYNLSDEGDKKRYIQDVSSYRRMFASENSRNLITSALQSINTPLAKNQTIYIGCCYKPNSIIKAKISHFTPCGFTAYGITDYGAGWSRWFSYKQDWYICDNKKSALQVMYVSLIFEKSRIEAQLEPIKSSLESLRKELKI